MNVFKIVALLLLTSTQIVYGQADHLSQLKFISVSSDNDLYYWFGYSQDRYYTAGNSLIYGFGARPTSKWVNAIMYTPFRQSTSLFDIRITQQLNTPEALYQKEVQVGDYPYATALYVGVGRTSLSLSGSKRFRNEVWLGVLGPGALGKEFQTSLHSIVRSTYPEGWDNQLPNQFIFNYNLGFETKLASWSHKKHIMAVGSTTLGTLQSGLQLGLSFNFCNQKNIYFNDLQLAAPSRKALFFLSLSPSLKWTAWNSMLEGNPLEGSQKTYRIAGDQIQRIITVFNLSLGVAKGRHILQAQQTFMSKEFSTVEGQVYGTIAYTYILQKALYQ